MLIGGTLLSRSSAGWGISWSSGRSTECKVDPPYALAETVTAGATRRLRGADPLVVPRPFALAQHELLDLASRRLGQGPELDRVRALEVREPLATERDDLLRRRGGAIA